MRNVNINISLAVDSDDTAETEHILKEFSELISTVKINEKMKDLSISVENQDDILMNFMRSERKTDTQDYVLEYEKIEAIRITEKKDIFAKPVIIKDIAGFRENAEYLALHEKPVLQLCSITGRPIQEGYTDSSGSWVCAMEVFPSYMDKKYGKYNWKEENGGIYIAVANEWAESGIVHVKWYEDDSVKRMKKAGQKFQKITNPPPKPKTGNDYLKMNTKESKILR